VPVMQDSQRYPNLRHIVAFQLQYFAGVNFQNNTTQSMNTTICARAPRRTLRGLQMQLIS